MNADPTPSNTQDNEHDSPHPVPTSPTSRDRSTFAVAAVVAAIATMAVGGVALVTAVDDESTAAKNERPLATLAEPELGNSTLDELANDLAEFGLEVHIAPAGVGDQNDGQEQEHEEPVEVTDGDQTEPSVDPFEGLSDDEIDALSDDEYFDRIEAAGLDVAEYFDELEPGDTGPDDLDEDANFGEETLLGVAPVSGDSIDLSGFDDDAAEEAQSIWGRFVALIPADQRQMVSAFELDGGAAGGAYVYQDDSEPTKWVLGVSVELGDQLDFTLIHEFGHLLTLQAEAVPPDTGEAGCLTYFTGEGCALRGSTMAEFVQAFWPQSQLDEINRLEEADDYEGLDAFYAEHDSDFVTDYATTNPGEDLAETFTIFVLEDRPLGDSIADQKVQMLWGDADLVALRDEIRSSL